MTYIVLKKCIENKQCRKKLVLLWLISLIAILYHTKGYTYLLLYLHIFYYIYMCVMYVYMCEYVCMYTWVHECVRACMHTCMCACVRVCMCVCVHVHVCVYVHVCARGCVYVCIRILIYISKDNLSLVFISCTYKCSGTYLIALTSGSIRQDKCLGLLLYLRSIL